MTGSNMGKKVINGKEQREDEPAKKIVQISRESIDQAKRREKASEAKKIQRLRDCLERTEKDQ